MYWIFYDALTFNFHLKHPVFCHDEDIKELLELDLLEKRLSNGYSFSDKQQSSKTQTATKSALKLSFKKSFEAIKQNLSVESIKTSPFSARRSFMIVPVAAQLSLRHPVAFYDYSLITKLNIGNEMQSCSSSLGGLVLSVHVCALSLKSWMKLSTG